MLFPLVVREVLAKLRNDSRMLFLVSTTAHC